MDDSSKLKELKDIAFRPEYDEVYEQLALGKLTADEEASLRDSPDPEVRWLYELFRPLDDSFKRRFQQLIVADAPAANPPVVPGVTRLEDARTKSSHRKRQIFVASGLSLFAAVVVLVLFFADKEHPATPLAVASLERATPGHSPGDAQMGGIEPSRPAAMRLRAGICWHVQLKPPPSGRPPAEVRAYFAKGDSVVAWDAAFTVQPNDTLVPMGSCAKLPPLAAGEWDFLVLSGRHLPSLSLEGVAKACLTPQQNQPRWRCDRQRVEISSE